MKISDGKYLVSCCGRDTASFDCTFVPMESRD